MRYVEQEIHGYTWSPQTLTDGDTIVVISYTDGGITKTVEVPIVVHPAIINLQITSPLDKLTYKTGELLDLTGLAVTVFYTDGSSADITNLITVEPSDISILSAGTHNINIKFEDKIVSFEITIEQDALPIPSLTNELVYNGLILQPIWDNFNESLIDISGITSNINAGTFLAIFSLKDPTANSWADGTIENKIVDWEIKKAKVLAIPQQVGTLLYTGSPQSPVWENYDSSIMTINGSTSESAQGTYYVTFTLDDNHEWEDGTIAKQITWAISQGVIMTIPSLNGTLTYNGFSLTPNWLNYNSNLLTIAGTTSAVDAGTYKVRFAPTANYTWSDGTTNEVEVEWIINKMTITASPTLSGILTYNGSPQSPSWNNYNSNYLTITGGSTSEINAGEYLTVFTPTANCTWANGSSDGVTSYWTINKEKAVFSLSLSSITVELNELVSVGFSTNIVNYDDFATSVRHYHVSGSGSISVNTYNFTTSYMFLLGIGVGNVRLSFLILESENYLASDIVYLDAIVTGAGWEWGDLTATGAGDANWWKGLSEWISKATTSELEACIGKTKSTTLSSPVCGATTHLVRCIGANVDASKTLTFLTKNCLPTATAFASSNTGWSSSTVRNLCQSYYNYFPGKNYILSVSKGTNTTYNTSSVAYTTETVWLASIHEMGYSTTSTSNYTPVGAEFTRYTTSAYQYFTNNATRIKNASDSNSTASFYWTRSYIRNGDTYRCCVSSSSGNPSLYTYSNTTAVRLAPAFTIKGT